MTTEKRPYAVFDFESRELMISYPGFTSLVKFRNGQICCSYFISPIMKVEIFSVFGAAILSSGLADGATLLAYVHEGFPPVSASVVTHRASAKPAHHISPRIKKYVRFGISNMKYETNSTDRISSSQQIGKDYRTDIMSGFGNPDTNLDTSPERRLLTDFFAATYLNGDDIVRILSGDRGIVNLAGHDPHASLGVGSQVEPIEFLSSREINYLAGDYGRWNE